MGEDILINSVAQTETKESEQLVNSILKRANKKNHSSQTNVINEQKTCYGIISEPFLGTHFSQHSWQATVKYPEVTLN